MREIKFRVWTNGKMTNVEHPESIEYYGGRLTFWDQQNHSCDLDAIIMKWTGLKDKNNNPIYEGDIVQYENKADSVEWVSENDGYDYTGWCCNSVGYSQISEGEVIGNKYNNPELLKQ